MFCKRALYDILMGMAFKTFSLGLAPRPPFSTSFSVNANICDQSFPITFQQHLAFAGSSDPRSCWVFGQAKLTEMGPQKLGQNILSNKYYRHNGFLLDLLSYCRSRFRIVETTGTTQKYVELRPRP